MPVAMPHPEALSQNSSRSVKQRLLVAQFGDGYAQTAADGINSVFEEWSLSWENVTPSERNTITTALRQAATDYLTWTPTQFGDSTPKRYSVVPNRTADLYTETQAGGGFYTITTNLRQRW